MSFIKKLATKFENGMCAITFAEAGEEETARHMLNETKTAGTVEKAVNIRSESFAERHDRAMEAITFAEAGEHEHAQALLKGSGADNETEKEKIIVIGYEEGFSDKLINYALGMAERMNYEIAALNVIPVGKRLFSSLHEKIKDEFKTKTEKGAEVFKTRALQKNIRFSHTVKFGDIDKTINELSREFKRVTFILTEPEHISDEAATTASIPVFCLSEA